MKFTKEKKVKTIKLNITNITMNRRGWENENYRDKYHKILPSTEEDGNVSS